MLYTFETETPEELCEILARNTKRRRLEQNLSRKALSEYSGVPAPTIAKWEQQHTISLHAYVAIVKALGYTDEVKKLLSESRYSTMEELEEINRNKNRQRGSK